MVLALFWILFVFFRNFDFKGIHDDKKKAAFRAKIGDYFDRAEKLKRLIDEIKECKCLGTNIYFIVVEWSSLIIHLAVDHSSGKVSRTNTNSRKFNRKFIRESVCPILSRRFARYSRNRRRLYKDSASGWCFWCLITVPKLIRIKSQFKTFRNL